MASKEITDKDKYNTLDHAKSAVLLVMGAASRKPQDFTKQEEVDLYLARETKTMIDLGDFSYDPTYGEMIFAFKDDLDVHQLLADGVTSLAKAIEIFYLAEGWKLVSIIPARAGNNKTMVRVRSDLITDTELAQQGSRVARALGVV